MSELRQPPPRLVFERDGREVEVPLAQDECTIGRGPANDLRLDRPTISRRHARLVRASDGWRVEDRGSLKGTTIDGGGGLDRPLRDGDVIRLGRFPVTFRAAASPAAEETRLLDADGLLDDAPAALDPSQTVVQPAVDFSELAAGQPRAASARLERLLTVVTDVSRAVLGPPGEDRPDADPSDEDPSDAGAAAEAPARRETATFDRVLEIVFDHLPVERGCILRWEAATRTLRPVCSRVREGAASVAASGLPFSRTIAATVLRDRVAISTTDALRDARFSDGASVMDLGIRSAMCAPLWHGDRVLGLISVDASSRTDAFDRFDLDLLSAIGNHLALATIQARLEASILAQQLVRRRLERYHSPAVVERIVAGDPGGAGGAWLIEEREVTVLFADLVGFTARSERMPPRDVAAWLNRCFEAMAAAVFLHEGTLDKFLGDGLMAVFGAPIAQDDHAARAMRAAIAMRSALGAVEPPDDRGPVACRIGLHSGPVVAGDLGSRRRRDYTVLGATVNAASRLESSVATAGRIVLSEATLAAAGDGFDVRPLGEHALVGFTSGTVCFELLDVAGRAP